jgi:hypothetical protein
MKYLKSVFLTANDNHPAIKPSRLSVFPANNENMIFEMDSNHFYPAIF